jgi:hypothetical protein
VSDEGAGRAGVEIDYARIAATRLRRTEQQTAMHAAAGGA